VTATSQDLNSVVEINRREAIHLWLFIFLGGLFGVGMSEITMHMDSTDEVTSLASSINRMQENLREMIRTMMEISGIVSEDSAKLSRSTNESFRRTKKQSLQTQQAAAAMQEMSISIAEVSRHAQSAATTSK
jgi:methyl-accepting chemotaxis protein